MYTKYVSLCLYKYVGVISRIIGLLKQWNLSDIYKAPTLNLTQQTPEHLLIVKLVK